MTDLTQGNWTHFILTFFVLTGAIFLRYILMAGVFYYLINIKYASRLQHRKISRRPGRHRQYLGEIFYSLMASGLFAVLGTLVLYSWQKGGTAIYVQLSEYHWSWIPVSLLLVLLLHETYYYWIHRLMHRPGIYPWIHRVHHESLTPSAWTSFSFHPLESLLQALPIFILIYILPMHPISLVLIFIIMSVTSVINHLNSELYPSGSSRHWFGKWWIGATHHNLHHTQFKYNYGLYFTFWDHWMNTESPDYQKTFEDKTGSG